MNVVHLPSPEGDATSLRIERVDGHDRGRINDYLTTLGEVCDRSFGEVVAWEMGWFAVGEDTVGLLLLSHENDETVSISHLLGLRQRPPGTTQKLIEAACDWSALSGYQELVVPELPDRVDIAGTLPGFDRDQNEWRCALAEVRHVTVG